MPDDRLELKGMIEQLETQRDELRVRLHLAKAEAREEFERLEKRFDHIRGRVGVLTREMGEVSKDVGEAARLVLGELKNGYQRIRELM